MFSSQTRRFFAALLCVTQEKATQYGAKTAFDEAMVSCEETPKGEVLFMLGWMVEVLY